MISVSNFKNNAGILRTFPRNGDTGIRRRLRDICVDHDHTLDSGIEFIKEFLSFT